MVGGLVCLVGCGPFVTTPRECTEEARASGNVIVKDADGAPVSDARVDYILDGKLEPCENFGDGSYVCGYEQSGDFSITAVKGTMSAGADVTVTRDACHVESEVVELTLMPGSF